MLYKLLVLFFKTVKKAGFINKYIRSFVVDAYWSSRLNFKGKGVVFFKGVIIHSPEKVLINDSSRIGDYVQMWGGGGIKIGKNVLIANHSVITSQSHDIHAALYINSQIMAPVEIEDNVWIGASVVILPGVTIGRNSIIGAGAVVTQSIPSDSIAFGIPARVINTVPK